MDQWVHSAAAEIARRAERELEALVAVSSPSGDVHGAQECAALCAALAPEAARLERPPCSSPDHAPDVLLTLTGGGRARVLLLGHIDTVVAHADHRPLERRRDQLVGSGAVDMKGGVVLALGALRALAAHPERYAEVALLLVCDEEWRTGPLAHVERFAGWDACLCFEAGELADGGAEGVVVRRKAAATVRVRARGRSAHSGSAPERGRNALLALATAAEAVAACNDPHGPQHLSAVPTVVHAGEAFNVVPGRGELFCDCRADDLAAVDALLAVLPREVGGVALEPQTIRRWPGMTPAPVVAPVLERASTALGRPVRGVRRGGASDASHMAPAIPVTIDGLGPRGGKAHNPGEFVLTDSIPARAQVALAVLDAVLD